MPGEQLQGEDSRWWALYYRWDDYGTSEHIHISRLVHYWQYTKCTIKVKDRKERV